MPIHDWSRVDPGIFHHFHLHWIRAIADVLNQRLLPTEYYALIERQVGGFESDREFSRRKQDVVVVRHSAGDHLAATVAIISIEAEVEIRIQGIIEPLAVGDTCIKMPLFLEPGQHVEVPIEETYRLAFESVPRRWRMVLEPG